MYWSFDKNLNENNFNLSINLIQTVMNTYIQSLDTVILESFTNKELDLKNIQLFETLSTFIDNYPPSVRPYVKQTVIAIGGVSIKHPQIGVIAFRGTSNNQEWIKDAQSLQLVSLPNIPETTSFSDVESLQGIDRSTIPDSLQIGNGFYKIYSTRIGNRNKSGCVCISNCQKHLCAYSQKGNYSMINKECNQKSGTCISKSGDSLNSQIYDYVNKMLHRGVKYFIITGHSLGGALANLCAFHLLHSFGPDIIHSIYSYAAPRTGNVEFALSLFPLYNKYHSIINSNDLVPNLPLPFPGCFSQCGKIKIFTELNPNNVCDLDYVWKMHDLETYRKNFNYLKG